MVVDPADPQDEETRSGGWYELALEFETSDEQTAGTAVVELWELAGVESAVGGQVLRLPDVQQVVCDVALVEEDGLSSWVILGLPLGALGRVDPRVGAYPFGDYPGSAWRRPLDDRLSSLAIRLFDVLPFSLALVGYDGGLHGGAPAGADSSDGPRPARRGQCLGTGGGPARRPGGHGPGVAADARPRRGDGDPAGGRRRGRRRVSVVDAAPS